MNNQPYIQPTDNDAFVDFPEVKKPNDFDKSLTRIHQCQKCKGHGGWNLRLNAYKLHGKEDTSQNRHNFSHFRASCDNCNGYGLVRTIDKDHIHDWKYIKSSGRCLHIYQCSICQAKKEVDSSD
jgi:DnaJ-class molecular chaperone